MYKLDPGAMLLSKPAPFVHFYFGIGLSSRPVRAEKKNPVTGMGHETACHHERASQRRRVVSRSVRVPSRLAAARNLVIRPCSTLLTSVHVVYAMRIVWAGPSSPAVVAAVRSASCHGGYRNWHSQPARAEHRRQRLAAVGLWDNLCGR